MSNFEGKQRHDFVTGANGVFARWGKDSVSGDSQAEENENRSGAIKPSSAHYPRAGLSLYLAGDLTFSFIALSFFS